MAKTKIFCRKTELFLSAEDLYKDVIYLTERQNKEQQSDSYQWFLRRTGASSDSIFRIAYKIDNLDNQRLPMDRGDLAACENTFNNLPDHRKTLDAYRARNRARDEIKKSKGVKQLREVIKLTESIQWHQ